MVGFSVLGERLGLVVWCLCLFLFPVFGLLIVIWD